jgi:hypothetical protein
MADLVQVNIRMTEAQKKELDSIIALSGGQGQSEVVNNIIHAEFDRINGNPEVRAVLEKLSELQEMLNQKNF